MNVPNTKQIVAMIVDDLSATFYAHDGEVFVLPTSRPATKALIETVAPIVAAHKTAHIDLAALSPTSIMQQKTGGLMRFVRSSVKKLGALFGVSDETVEAMQANGHGSESEVTVALVDIPDPAPAPAGMTEVQKKVVERATKTVAVPGVDALENHFMSEYQNPAAMEKFLQRIAAVIDKRGHSVQDLLTFMRKSDLPVADDGRIVAYKVLKTHPSNGKIVDCHTGNVQQRVGSIVEMDESLVDPNRRNECSNGLHIARRAYLKGFSGDKMMLVKIAPEDVIAVPQGDPDKMRVARYQIVAEVPKDLHAILRSNKAMTTDSEASVLLGNVLKGNHAEAIEVVKIGGHHGSNVKVTSLRDFSAEAPAPAPKLEPEVQAKAIDAASEPVRAPEQVQKVRDIGDKVINERKAAAARQEKPASKRSKPAAPPSAPAPKKAPQAAPTKSAKVLDKKDASAPPAANRDAQILKLVDQGKAYREIERMTGVSARTVKRIVDKRSA